MTKMSGLGRGLGSLIPQKAPAASAPSAPTASDGPVSDSAVRAENRILHIPVTDIVPNSEQPRIEFRHHELDDLANSIREHGIIQPLVVTTRPSGGYELIAGERRFRAAKIVGLQTVPAVVRNTKEDDKLVLALIENIQREDLNPMEEARGYARLMSEFGFTQEDVAKRVGKARSTVANTVRLLELPDEIQEAIASGRISAGSARAILSLKDPKSQITFFRKLIGANLNTRQAESAARTSLGKAARDPEVVAAEEQLRNRLGTRVEIKKRGTKGNIVIAFFSEEEYDGVMGAILS